MAMLVKGEQRIELHASDPGRFAYRSTLRSVDPAEFAQGSWAAWGIKRSYEPGPMGVEETAVPPAASASFPAMCGAEFSNRMTQLPAARRGRVELEITRVTSSSGRGAGGFGFCLPRPPGEGRGVRGLRIRPLAMRLKRP